MSTDQATEAARLLAVKLYGPLAERETPEHEAAFAALPEDEKNRRYAKFEQGTAGAWLGTYSR